MIDGCIEDDEKYSLTLFCNAMDESLCITQMLDERTRCDMEKLFTLIEYIQDECDDLAFNIVEEMPEEFKKDPKILELLAYDAKIFNLLDESLKNEEHIRAAIEINGEVLDVIFEEDPPTVNIDRDLVCLALKNGLNPGCLEDTSLGIELDKEMVKLALEGGCKLKDLPEQFINDLEILKYALKIDPFMPLPKNKLSMNKNIALELVRHSGNVIRWIPKELTTEYPEIIEESIKTFYASTQDAKYLAMYAELIIASRAALLKKQKKLLVKVFSKKKQQLFNEVSY